MKPNLWITSDVPCGMRLWFHQPPWNAPCDVWGDQENRHIKDGRDILRKLEPIIGNYTLIRGKRGIVAMRLDCIFAPVHTKDVVELA